MKSVIVPLIVGAGVIAAVAMATSDEAPAEPKLKPGIPPPGPATPPSGGTPGGQPPPAQNPNQGAPPAQNPPPHAPSYVKTPPPPTADDVLGLLPAMLPGSIGGYVVLLQWAESAQAWEFVGGTAANLTSIYDLVSAPANLLGAALAVDYHDKAPPFQIIMVFTYFSGAWSRLGQYANYPPADQQGP